METGQAEAVHPGLWCLDRDWPEIAGHADTDLDTITKPEHLAYCIYTSGSTGRPKGASNSHAGIINRLQWADELYLLNQLDRVLQKTPISFDVSVWELFWPLLKKAMLVVAPPEIHQDPAQLRALVIREQLTVLHFVPSMLQAFIASSELAHAYVLRQVMCSGEALSSELQQEFQGQHSAQLHNLYGPTEAAIEVSFWTCREEDRSTSVPIGRPIWNTQLYILDADLNPVPAGVIGELYIGGAGLARGYVGRPGLTARGLFRTRSGEEQENAFTGPGTSRGGGTTARSTMSGGLIIRLRSGVSGLSLARSKRGFCRMRMSARLWWSRGKAHQASS